MKPLTVGNVVSTGLRIYRDRFSDYYKLAFVGYLWLLVPLYGWIGLMFLLNFEFGDPELLLLGFFWLLIFIYCLAKYSARLGLISRLAFGEVTEKPESIREAQRSVKPKMWKFLVAGTLSNLIIFGASFVFLIIVLIVIGILVTAAGLNTNVGQDFDTVTIITSILLTLITIISFFFFLTWLISRMLMVETPLAIEENINATDAISRSWKLTKGSIFRLQLIIFVAGLITFPILILNYLIQKFLGEISSSSPELFSSPIFILTAIIGIGIGTLLIPFWQSIKAVIYYDLRVRREGLGLNLDKS